MNVTISLVAAGFYCQAEEDLLDPGEILKGGAKLPETSPVRASGESYLATGNTTLRPDSQRDDSLVLFMAERGRFAGGADGDDAGDAVVELKIDQFAKGVGINLVVGGERGDESREGAFVHLRF